ncbi:MAG: DUF177 domain-containing protein [Myxococcota bacterium]|nr:DUF177 domain-containing protein [Myxococcales bacterium]
MKLNLDRLDATPSHHAFEATAAWWAERVAEADEGPYEVVAPFRFELDAHKMGEDVYLAGAMSGALELECGRCVARYRQALRESFRLVLEPARGRVPLDPEGDLALRRDGMCLGDEVESGWYRGSEIQLDAWFAEIIALAMPVQPLCDEACKGLCPVCGADRNAGDCGCVVREDRPRSPFAMLGALKGASDPNRGE